MLGSQAPSLPTPCRLCGGGLGGSLAATGGYTVAGGLGRRWAQCIRSPAASASPEALGTAQLSPGPGYLPLHSIVAGLLLGGEALVLLLGVVICGTGT